ncbi:hypothetical protein ACI2LM_15590 [Paenibacillus lautus]|uniref:hypothetical protein n=1 Tax=Paenibacillus lautus TaxID=1401 RepID=UPI00384F8C79
MTRFVGIDPATKTGFVALDEQGNVLVEIEVEGIGKKMPGGITTEQLVSLENQVYKLLKPGDVIAIEQPAMGTQAGITTGMIHGGLRSMIYRKGMTYVDVNPQRTKKFVDVESWVGEKGSKRRLSDDEKKKAVAVKVVDHYRYSHSSHNVTDAYIIARISEAIHKVKDGQPLNRYPRYQQEVITAIINPEAAKGRPKAKPKTTKRRGKPAAADSHTKNTEQQCLF